jgi:hypothetical protein
VRRNSKQKTRDKLLVDLNSPAQPGIAVCRANHGSMNTERPRAALRRLLDAPLAPPLPRLLCDPKAAQPPLGLDSINAPHRRTATGSPHPCRRWGSRCVRCPFNRGGWAHHLPHQKYKIAKLKSGPSSCIHHRKESMQQLRLHRLL